MVNDEIYAKFARYYDTYVEGFQADIGMYMHFLRPGLRVLEIGCGTGRILSHLVNSGVQVLGVDISPEMLALAQQKLSHYTSTGILRLARHNLAISPLDEDFDRVYVAFYTFNYLLVEREAQSLLRNVFSSMKPGALLIMDLFYPLAYKNPDSEGQWEEKFLNLAGREIKLLDKRIVKDDIEKRIQIFLEDDSRDEIITYRRFYDKKAVVDMLQNAGFSGIMTTVDYDLTHFHCVEPGELTSSSFVMIAEKSL
ncbi:MAG TPA: methyltransferase [Syntrophomonadaceae bacterium]|nr:methyltransferase [Syntrophomonadaceae bacterium]